MPNSRTPWLTWLPAAPGAARTAPQPGKSVRFEPVRSALPPSSSGSSGASASSTFCEALRVATGSAGCAKRDIVRSASAWKPARQVAGHAALELQRLAREELAVAPRSGRATSLRHRRRARARSSRRRPRRAPRRARGLQPSAARVAAVSAAPSGAPCAFALPALFGEPLPMVVLQQISVGAVAAPCAAARAASSASTSWPSTRAITFQP